MKPDRSKFRQRVGIALGAFVVLNVNAFFQARSMTVYCPGRSLSRRDLGR